MKLEDYPLILTTKQACELLQCGKKFLYDAIKTGQIPARICGHGYRFHRDTLLKFIAEGSLK